MNWNQGNLQNMNQQTPSNKFGLHLTNKEIPYYQNLYSQLDLNQTGSINSKDAVNFIKRSDLPLAQLKQIWILVSSNSLVLVKEEFDAALRLIAYAQNGIEVSEHSLSQNIPTQLPKISGINLPAENNFQKDLKLQTLVEHQSPLVSSESQKPNSVQAHIQNFEFQDQQQYDISQETYNKLEDYYYTQDTQNKGHVQGHEARQLFYKSQLSKDQLKLIWSLCDSHTKGYLLKGEFIIALHLIALCRQGFKLPNHLSDNLLVVMNGQKPGSQMQGQMNPQVVQQGLQQNQPQRLNDHDEQDGGSSHIIYQISPLSGSTQKSLNSPPQSQANLQQDSAYRQLVTQQQDLQKQAKDLMLQDHSSSNDIIRQCVEEKKKEIEFLSKLVLSYQNIQNQLKKDESDLHQQLQTLEQQKKQLSQQLTSLDIDTRDQQQTNQKLRQQVIQQTHQNDIYHQDQSTLNSSRPISSGQIDHSIFGQGGAPSPINSNQGYGLQSGNATKSGSLGGQSQGLIVQQGPYQSQQQSVEPMSTNMDDDFSDYKAIKQRIASSNQPHQQNQETNQDEKLPW